MRARRVVYTEEYYTDLNAILLWLANTSSPTSAIRVVDDIDNYVAHLDLASERGIARNDLGPGIRMVPHARAVVAVEVTDDTVTVLRVFYGGQDWESAFAEEH